MKLLLDANLSYRMIAVLKHHFDQCLHVDNIGISVPAKDVEIWKYAKENELIIVTNDEDFVDIINMRGFPPKLILLKIGNQNRLIISNILIRHKTDILTLANSDEIGLLEIVNDKL